MFFDNSEHIRMTKELQERMDKLIALYPGKFENRSQVIRAAIMVLYNREVNLDGKRRHEDAGF